MRTSPPIYPWEWLICFPVRSTSVRAGLDSTPDIQIWEYAKANEFVFLKKDQGFASLSLTWGAPPKVVLLEIGNCSTLEVAEMVRSNAIQFAELDNDFKRTLLVLR